MEYGKYIIIEMAGHKLAVMFDVLISHADLCRSFHHDSIVSAGFFIVEAKQIGEDKEDITVDCFGKSDTLKEHWHEGDEVFIKRVLRNV